MRCRFSQKMKEYFFCLFFCFSWQTKQIHSFVFLENLRRAQTAFGFIWPLMQNWFWYYSHSIQQPITKLQANVCQKLLFLHQLTHNMTADCSLNYKFNTWKFQAQTWGEHVVRRNSFWHSEQFLYSTCSPHVLQKEELLTKIYL